MATPVGWELVKELAAFRAEKACAVSLYLNLDPSVTPTAVDVSTRVNSLLSRLGRQVDGESVAERRKSLRADVERIRSWAEDGFDRDGAHGLALFASAADNLWRTLFLSEPVEDLIRANSELHVAPLVPLVGRGEGAWVAAVGRERGEIYRLRGGRLQPVADQTDEQPRRHDQGGWSQANFQRHIDHLVHAHFARVADELDRRVRRGAQRIVVVASEETRAGLEDVISPEVRAQIVGWASAEAHAGPAELLAAASPVLAAWRAEEEARVLARWREETGRNGRATAGWEPTLEAASDGRVALLLYRHGVEHTAWRCPKCGRVAAGDGACPLDGTKMEHSEDGLDLALHQTLSNGGSVCAVSTRRDLDPVEGIGALLRY